MSIPMGMLMVWEEGELARDRAETALASAMELDAPLPRISGDVLDASRWLSDGVLAISHNPMGFDVISLRWSPNVLGRSDALTEQRMDSIERVAMASLDELRPLFGYLSHYGDHFDRGWVEQQVLVPILSEDWDHLVSWLYHLVLLSSDLPVPLPANGRIIHASDAGRIVRLGEHRSPFGPLGC